jgi:hypothetical protein
MSQQPGGARAPWTFSQRTQVGGGVDVQGQAQALLHACQGAGSLAGADVAVDGGWAKRWDDDVHGAQEQRVGAEAVTAGTNDDGTLSVLGFGNERFEVICRDEWYVTREDDRRLGAKALERLEAKFHSRVHVTWREIVDDQRAGVFRLCPRGRIVDDGHYAGEEGPRLGAHGEDIGEHGQRQLAPLRRIQGGRQP